MPDRAGGVALTLVIVVIVLALLGLLAYAIRSSRVRADLGYDNDPSNDPEAGHRGLRADFVVVDEVQRIGGRDRIMIPPSEITPETDPGEVDPVEADRIRAMVDRDVPRFHPDGQINTQHVAIEQTMRSRVGLPAYIGRLDGAAYRRSTDPQRSNA